MTLLTLLPIFNDFLDRKVLQFHVSVLGRDSAFLGIAGSGIVVSVHGNRLLDDVIELERYFLKRRA